MSARPRWWMVPGLVVVGSWGLAACAQTIDSDKLAANIQAKLAEVELKADTITCPPSIEARAGGQFECTATIQGIPVKIAVTQKDAQGNVTYDVGKEVFATEKVTPAIESYFKDQGATDVTLTCPKAVVVAEGNGTFTCTVSSDGQAYTVKVPLRDSVARMAEAEVTRS